MNKDHSHGGRSADTAQWNDQLIRQVLASLRQSAPDDQFARRVWMRVYVPVCPHGTSELSLRAHGNAHFRFQTPGQRPGGPTTISYQSGQSALAASDFMAAYLS